LLDFIALPLGQFLHFIYNFIAFKNYGLAIILFTIFVKLAILPLAVKQYRSMAKMQEVQPHLQEIQRKYKNDKEKLNQETLKIYQEYKVNPAGGCLPLLIQMPIIISLYWVIQKPLTYMLGLGHQITELAAQYGIDPTPKAGSNIEIEIITKNPDLINLSFQSCF
jgi:YidC/Oxa1 family membrane protein insertase